MRKPSDLIHPKCSTCPLDAVGRAKNRVQHFTVAAGGFQRQKSGFHVLKMFTRFFVECGSKTIQVNLHGETSGGKSHDERIVSCA